MTSVTDKLVRFMRNQVNQVTPQDIAHDKVVENETALKIAHAKKKWLIDYQTEREKKMLYIKQHL